MSVQKQYANWYYKAKAMGVCTNCGKKPPGKTTTLCDECKAKRDRYVSRWRAEQKEKKKAEKYDCDNVMTKKMLEDVKIVMDAWDFGEKTFEQIHLETGISMRKIRYILPGYGEGGRKPWTE